jgi:hypothetical protein
MYSKFLQVWPDSRGLYRSIAFADDRYYPQLQAADLLAWVMRAHCLNLFHGHDFSMRKLYDDFCQREPTDVLDQIYAICWDKTHMAKIKPIRKIMREHHARMKPE